MARPRDPSGRYLPSIQALGKRSIAQLVETLRRFGMPVDIQALADIAERVTRQLADAENPSDALQEQVQARIESNMQRELAHEAKTFVRESELRANGLRGKGALEQSALWVAVMDAGTCDDCEERHGEEATMREWNGRGLPGSANLVCGSNCRCYLAPTEMFEGELPPENVEELGDIQVEITTEMTRD